MHKVYIVIDLLTRKVSAKNPGQVNISSMEILEEVNSKLTRRVVHEKARYWNMVTKPFVDVRDLPYHFVSSDGKSHFYSSRQDRLPRRFRKYTLVS